MKHTPATEMIQSFLEAEKHDKQGHPIWTQNNVVIDRLLACGDSLESAWAEILDKCPPFNPHGSEWACWQFAVDSIVNTAGMWNLDSSKKAREAKRRVADLNAEIAKAATDLAGLIRKRAAISLQGDISLPNDDTPLDLMERAADLSEDANPHLYSDMGGRYRDSIKPLLEPIQARFDWQYWPTTAGLLDALAEAQDQHDPHSTNRFLAAAMDSRKSGNRDFLRAFNVAWRELNVFFPLNFELSASSWAALANAALGLDGEITREEVTNFRSVERRCCVDQ